MMTADQVTPRVSPVTTRLPAPSPPQNISTTQCTFLVLVVASVMALVLVHLGLTSTKYLWDEVDFASGNTSTNLSNARTINKNPPSLPGNVHLPYAEERYVNITKRPVDLYKEKPKSKDTLNPHEPKLKKILFWNDAYGYKHFGMGFGREPFLRAGCRVNTCMTTGDRTRFPPEEIDALLWHFRAKDKSLPKKRSAHTRYVFWMMESASYLNRDLGPYKHVFNWTFTYRLDSDFPNPYGRVYLRRQPLELDDRNYSAGKTKLAAWFVSNCYTQSGREVLVARLQKWMRVDQYGGCGKLKCDRGQQWNKCYAMLNTDYKFYLSFENSLCQDYATEKFFNILSLDVVPVVYGLGTYAKQAPPYSYIDALSFTTARDLADYLNYLDKNDTAYNEYFTWKRFHHIPHDWARVAKPFCDLCERLHDDNAYKVYDIRKWFLGGGRCKTRLSADIQAFINGG